MASKFRQIIRRLLQKSPKEHAYHQTVFRDIWRKHKETKDGKTEDKLIEAVISDVKNKIDLNELNPEQIVQEAFTFTMESDNAAHHTRNKQILLELVDILATHTIQNRALVRSILTTLFSISKCVDRELIFFEQADQTRPVRMDEQLLVKQTYVLEQTAGWLVEGKVWNATSPNMYLELPFRRASSTANSNIMAEALYRQQDPEFVLRLLQHGLQPSCLYLWPTCILIDLKFTLSDHEPLTQESIMHSNEAIMVRYFCRARHYIHVHAVKTEERGHSMANLPDGVGYDDILLVPPKAVGIIPESRFRHPSSLQHQCRLRIRKSIQIADQLPSGINSLPLPKTIKQYLHLLMD